MSFEKQFLDMSTGQITVAPLSTVTDYGAPQYSTSDSSSYTAYVEVGTRVVVTSPGVEEIATATVYVLSSSAGVGPQDLLTLPSGAQPRLLRVDQVNDDEGQHHLQLLIA